MEVEGQLAPVPAIRAAVVLAGSRSGSGLQRDDDDDDDDDHDHDACDDEFSSCGQLDLSSGREREREWKRDFTEKEWKNEP